MLFLLSLVFAVALSLLLRKPIHKKPVLFYLLCIGGAAALSLAYFLTDYTTWPSWFVNYVAMSFARGALSTALFVIVMFIGALPGKFPGLKQLRIIRGELSIFACILMFGHNIYYGMYYFPHLLFEPRELEWPYIVAAIITVALILIALPLFVTSFRTVRRRMIAKRWKALQRWAYLFYGLLYAHIMLVFCSAISRDITNPHGLAPEIISAQLRDDVISVAVYSAVFLTYFVLKLRKRFRKAGVL
jgi:DMSO/TMAO reductase YedYZ heme-binding membrane subunit